MTRLHALHHPGHLLILPNAWDALSARLVEEAGTEAIATTSAALAWALVTVLYRPFVFEADSLVQLGVALEGMFLLLLTLRRWRTIWSAISSMRSSPFIAYAFTFAGLFIIAFSSIGNFGILTRQRVQLYPFVLVLLAWPLVARRKPEEHSLVDELDVAR